MKYAGSKRRLAKHLLPIILKGRKPGQMYVEPFIGGGNLFDHVANPRFGSDSNPQVIAALEMIRDYPLKLPKNNTQFPRSHYRAMRLLRNHTVDGLVAYCGFALAYGGVWYTGYRSDKKGNRDYVAESFRAALEQSPNLQGSHLYRASFDECETPPGSIIYCDPPYANVSTIGQLYRGLPVQGRFDGSTFWEWCRQKTRDGHKVFISEYDAPPDFTPIWSLKRANSLSPLKTTSVEKLFIYSGP